MLKRRITWSKNARIYFLEILKYYTKKNKSNFYSKRLNQAIKSKLNSLDFSITLPKKTEYEGLYFLTHNHISVFFKIKNINEIYVILVIDERRNPEMINKMLQNL